jgi:hypothetical protein
LDPLDAVRDPVLFEQTLQVCLDRALGKMQPLGDLGVRTGFNEKLDNRGFPIQAFRSHSDGAAAFASSFFSGTTGRAALRAYLRFRGFTFCSHAANASRTTHALVAPVARQ